MKYGWPQTGSKQSRQTSQDLDGQFVDEDMPWTDEQLVEQARKAREEEFGEVPASTSGDDMQVLFREVDPFDLWLWMELKEPPSPVDKDLLEAVLTSWFLIGRIGGFNSMNLQMMYKSTEGASHFKYDTEQCAEAMDAYFHEMADLEDKGMMGLYIEAARGIVLVRRGAESQKEKKGSMSCWVNMGTADELALDVLINSLWNFSRENVPIKQLVVGGVNKDWDIPKKKAKAPEEMDY